MARPTKHTPEIIAKIIEAIKMGATYELAAGYAGVSYETLRQWMRDKPAFLEDMKRAEGTAAMVWLAKIERAASDGNWQAAAWKLERRHPEMYGRNVVVNEHHGEQQIRVIMDSAWRGEPQVIEEAIPQIAASATDSEAVDTPAVKVTFAGDGAQ
jgi:transposase